MKIRLKNNWFDQNAVRRRVGIIYTVPDSYEDQLPSGTEILNDANDVERVVEKPKPETQKVISVDVTTDADAKTEVSKATEVKKDDKAATPVKL